MSSLGNTTDHPSVRGRPFPKGNPGRPPGSKNRSTLISQALKAIEIAKAGNVSMLKFLLSRVLPRERPVKIDLPSMNFADDGVEALGTIVSAVSQGKISASEGAAMATLINSYARAIDIADVVRRVDLLEERLKGESKA